jgi:uncharacterized glyoxalase superfamily protein PhnB
LPEEGVWNTAAEAVKFYKDAFGMTLRYNERNPDGNLLHATLFRNGDEIFVASESQNDNFVEIMLRSSLRHSRPAMSLGVNFNLRGIMGMKE